MPRSIKAWSLCVVWDTGEEQVITDIPGWAAGPMDEFLDELEAEARRDAESADAEDNGVWQAYDGVCPDCGEDIPVDVQEGDQCANCGSVFKGDSDDE